MLKVYDKRHCQRQLRQEKKKSKLLTNKTTETQNRNVNMICLALALLFMYFEAISLPSRVNIDICMAFFYFPSTFTFSYVLFRSHSLVHSLALSHFANGFNNMMTKEKSEIKPPSGGFKATKI